MTSYDAIYLSPHLDDVALSCGGQLWDRSAAGQRILVVTVTAGQPEAGPLSEFARRLHARWELAAEPVHRRRQEDAAACRRLGVEYRHWDVLDAIYRRHPETGAPLYATESALFGAVHPADEALQAELARRLRELPTAAEVVAPLAIGRHVDHQLTRAAARGMPRLRYYEDYPYVRWETAAERALQPDPSAWRAEVAPVSQAGIQARIEAVAAYDSQVSSFFADQADLAAQIRQAVAAAGGERLWRPVPGD